MHKVLFTLNGFTNDDIVFLKENGIEIIEAPGDLNEENLIKLLEDCDGYVIGGSDKATRNVIEATNLKLINFYGTGYQNYIDVQAANEKQIIVANTPQANAYTVAEHAVALILDAAKQITALNNSTKRGEWNRRQAWNLQNKTLGIFGMGTIGSYVAKIMHDGFGMKVLYTSRSNKPEIESRLEARKVDLNELMQSSDVVSLHATFTPELASVISELELSKMKKHAILVNAARAELVDGHALKNALETKKLACAAFDAYYQEPSPLPEKDEYGLLSLPDNKFIITPHTAYSSNEAIENMNSMVKENLLAFFRNKPVPYKVN